MKNKIVLISLGLAMAMLTACGSTSIPTPNEPIHEIATPTSSSDIITVEEAESFPQTETNFITETPDLDENQEETKVITTETSDGALVELEYNDDEEQKEEYHTDEKTSTTAEFIMDDVDYFGPVETLYDEGGISYCQHIDNCVNYFLSFSSEHVSEDIQSLQINYYVDNKLVRTRVYDGGLKKDANYFVGLERKYLQNCDSLAFEFIVNDDPSLTWSRGIDINFEDSFYAVAYDCKPDSSGSTMQSVLAG